MSASEKIVKPSPDRKTNAALGLTRGTGTGTRALLRALVRRGLSEGAYLSAAALVQELDGGCEGCSTERNSP